MSVGNNPGVSFSGLWKYYEKRQTNNNVSIEIWENVRFLETFGSIKYVFVFILTSSISNICEKINRVSEICAGF